MQVTIAVLVGTGLAAFAVMSVVRVLRKRIERLPLDERPRWTLASAITVAVVAFPFAWWAGFILGGNFGGAFAAAVAEDMGAQRALVPVGISLGIALVTSAIVTVLCVIAFETANLLQRR